MAITFIALLTFLTGLFFLLFKFEKDEYGDAEFHFLPKNNSKKKLGLMLIIASIPIYFITSLFFFPDAGTNYTLQSKLSNDKKTIWNKTGITYCGFSSITPVDNEIVIKTLTPKHYDQWLNGDRKEAVETYVVKANGSSFNDKIGVWFETTTIIETNPSNSNYTQIVVNGKSEANIVRQRIMPFINEVSGLTAKLFGTEQYIEGAKALASEAFFDQLKYGKYAIVEEESPDLYEEVADSTQNRTTKRFNQTVTRYSIKRDGNGDPIRIGKGLSTYGFDVRQALIEDEEMHADFEDRLKTVRALEADNQELRQKAEKARRQQELNRENGEANKIEEQMAQEKEQISKVIKAKTAAEEAKYFLETQQRILEAEKVATQVALENKKQKEFARQGGVDPLERLKLELQNRIDVANAVFGGKALSSLETNISSGGVNGDPVATMLNWMMTQQLKPIKSQN
jgi:hypothetical protein